MRRADRLFEILQVLRRAKGPLTAAAIAEQLETSQRTVYRDLAALMARKVPIRGEAGVGYVLDLLWRVVGKSAQVVVTNGISLIFMSVPGLRAWCAD